jgi:capsular polysaccharide biosynthesis protein
MQARSAGNGYVEVSDYGRVLLRRWYVVALCVVIGVVGAFYYDASAKKTYASTTSVLVTATDAASTTQLTGARTTGPVDLDTEAQLVRSSVIAADARQLMRSNADLKTLINRVSVTVPPNTAVLAIRYEADTARAAREGSHSFAVAYLNDRADKAQANVDAQVTSLQSQIKQLSQQLQVVTGKIADLPSTSPDRTLATAQQSILISQISTLNDKLAPLQSVRITPGDIISDASTPTTTGLPKIVFGLSGALGGLLVGLAAAFAADRLGRRLRTRDDVARVTGEHVLVEVPKKAFVQHLAYERLANRVSASVPAKSVVVVAGADSDGVARVVAQGLADSLRRRGDRSVLLSVDGARPTAEVVAEANARLRDGYRYIVLAGGSLTGGADAQRLAEDAGATVVVVERGQTRKASLRQAVELLGEVNATYLGTVLTGREPRPAKPAPTGPAHARTGGSTAQEQPAQEQPAQEQPAGGSDGIPVATGSRSRLPIADDAADGSARRR